MRLWLPLALIALASPAAAGYHSAPIVDGLLAYGVPEEVARPIGFVVDNTMHFVAHVWITLTTLVTTPLDAVFMLNALGEACFAAGEAPMIHALFANALFAMITALVTVALLAMLLTGLYRRFSNPDQSALNRQLA